MILTNVWKFACPSLCVATDAANSVPVVEQQQSERGTAKTAEPEVRHSCDDKDAGRSVDEDLTREPDWLAVLPSLTGRGER